MKSKRNAQQNKNQNKTNKQAKQTNQKQNENSAEKTSFANHQFAIPFIPASKMYTLFVIVVYGEFKDCKNRARTRAKYLCARLPFLLKQTGWVPHFRTHFPSKLALVCSARLMAASV